MCGKNFIMLSGFYHHINISIKTRIRVVSLLVFLIPVYFFTIGDSYGGGFQTPVFRYQEIFLGSFMIFISNDLYHVVTGFFQAPMVSAVILWGLGFFCLLVNAIYVFIGKKPFKQIIRSSGIFIVISGIFFLVSLLVRYGPLFHNSSGAAIPLGLLLIFLLGIWVYQKKDGPEDIDGQV
jgi:hypothetical protein